MTTGVVTPDEATFRELARAHRVVPVTRRLLADGETPVGVYRKLAGGPGTFLLESAEQGAASAARPGRATRSSGVRSVATLTERDGAGGVARRAAGRRAGRAATRSSVLRETVARWPGRGAPATGADLPPLTGGLVGFLSYDVGAPVRAAARAGRRRPAASPSSA